MRIGIVEFFIETVIFIQFDFVIDLDFNYYVDN